MLCIKLLIDKIDSKVELNIKSILMHTKFDYEMEHAVMVGRSEQINKPHLEAGFSFICIYLFILKIAIFKTI